MDTIDRKLLALLDQNPRAALSRLARTLRISQQVAHYRLKRLLENKSILHLGAVIDYHKLGFQQYRIIFTFSHFNEKEKDRLFQYLQQDMHVYWAARIGGKGDFIIIIIVEDYHDLTSFLDSLYNNFKGFIRGHSLMRTMYQELLQHKKIVENFSHFSIDSRPKRPFQLLEKLDALDYQIFHALKENARMSSLALGQELGVNYKTIQNRIHKLQREGFIAGYRVFMNLRTASMERYQLLLRIDNYTQSDIINLLSFARQKRTITQSILTIGAWDFYFHLHVRDAQEIQTTIIEMRDKFPFIKDYEYSPIFEDIVINLLPQSKALIQQHQH